MPGLHLPLTLLFLDMLLPRVIDGVERLSVSVLAHDQYSHAGNCTGLPSNIVLFLSTGNIFHLPFQRHSSPFDSWPLLLFRFSRVWRQSFAIGVSDLYFFSPSFSFFDYWASISSDESPSRTILKWFWVVQTHVFSLCTDWLSRTSSDGIFDRDNKTSSRLVSNSWTLSSRRVTENKSA